MKKMRKKHLYSLLLAVVLLAGSGCGYRGRVIAQDVTAMPSDISAAAPQILSPTLENSAQTKTQRRTGNLLCCQ